MKRKFPAIFFVAASLMAGVSLYLTRASGSGQDGKRIDRVLDYSDLWPASRSWVWNIDPIGSKKQVGVCVRTTESKIAEGTSPSFPVSPELIRTGVEQHSGWSLLGGQRISGRVTCQVIDFREVGLGEAAGKKPLRLLVRLRIGGNQIGINGQASVLDGESFAASTEVEPKWVGDELHLLTVYSRTDDILYAHHVILQQRDAK